MAANPVDHLWPVLRRVMGGHTAIYKLSGGRLGKSMPGAPPMLLLDHVGAKSGKHRTSPLGYITDGEDYVVIASKGGHPHNPGWYHNLVANPDTRIQVGPDKIPVHARVATEAEHARLWPQVVSAYSGFDSYQQRTERKIPLVILEPR